MLRCIAPLNFILYPVIKIAPAEKIVSLTCFECMDEPAQCAQGTDDEDDTERANNESDCAKQVR